jgi:hypothetical protein
MRVNNSISLSASGGFYTILRKKEKYVVRKEFLSFPIKAHTTKVKATEGTVGQSKLMEPQGPQGATASTNKDNDLVNSY